MKYKSINLIIIKVMSSSNLFHQRFIDNSPLEFLLSSWHGSCKSRPMRKPLLLNQLELIFWHNLDVPVFLQLQKILQPMRGGILFHQIVLFGNGFGILFPYCQLFFVFPNPKIYGNHQHSNISSKKYGLLRNL
jgi:hypothetical protein